MSADRKQEKKAEAGYDKYIDWKIFFIPVVLLFAVLLLPPTKGMVDVGTQYGVGDKVVNRYLAEKMFGKKPADLEQWQMTTVSIMEKSLRTAALSRSRFLERDQRWCRKNNIAADKANLDRAKEFVKKMTDMGEFVEYADAGALKERVEQDSEMAATVLKELGMYGMNKK